MPTIRNHINKNAVFFDVILCGSSKKRRFEGTYRLLDQGVKNRPARNIISSVPSKRRFLQEPQFFTFKKTAFFIATALKNPKSYIALTD
jgi:hypothetical protein